MIGPCALPDTVIATQAEQISAYDALLATGVPGKLLIAGREYVVIGQNPWNTKAVAFAGESGWFQFEVRQNERPKGDSLGVDRIGFDGWPTPHDGDIVHEFSFVPGQNVISDQAGEWLNFFELHAVPASGDKHRGAGPLYFALDGGAPGPLRIYLQKPLLDAAGALTGTKKHAVYETRLTQDQRYDFRVEARAGAEGYVKITLNGTVVVNYRGPFGYGARKLYPQFRLYRNTRSETSKALIKIVR